MSILFSGSELLEVALGIEKNGAAFYQALADKTKNKDAKAIYDYLAGEEKKHLNTFQNMLNSVGKYRPPEGYGEEYMLYLKSLIDSAVFTDVASAQEKAEKVSSEIEALGIGIQAEKDSILFYLEMQNLVSPPDGKVVSTIIDEERDHLRQLSELKHRVQESR
ncbi:MAG: ferritin family protein [Dehalococcoidia bacterium]|nr:ferritin family protein [Dehalococcoidia bacterium]